MTNEELNEYVKYLYCDCKFSARKLSRDLKISQQQVRKILIAQNIPIRNCIDAHKLAIAINYKNQDFFNIIDSHEKAYWIGFLLADGSISTNSHTTGLSLAIIDKHHVEKFANIFEASVHTSSSKPSKLINTYCEYAYCRIFNDNIYNDLKKLGFRSDKTYSGYVDVLEKINTEYINSVILGLLDGDGSIFITDSLTFTGISVNFSCKNKKELEWIKFHLLKNVNNINNNSIVGRTFYKITWSGKQCKQLLEWLYKDSPIYLDRKKKIFDTYKF